MDLSKLLPRQQETRWYVALKLDEIVFGATEDAAILEAIKRARADRNSVVIVQRLPPPRINGSRD